jgi:glycosyltransferase involved in cell wall biosynthesis
VVITVHGHDLKDLPRRERWRALVSRALRGAQAVVAVSEDLAARARDLGADPGRVRVIPNGVDCEVFRPATTRQPGAGGWKLLYVGRFDPAKGVGVLLEALARLRQRRADVTLSLVGGNPATGAAEPFRRQAEALGLAGAVEFVDEVAWSELPLRLAQADVFVLPSFSEGLPLVLVEAMACGLPIVATRCGGPEELVGPATGRLVQPGAVAELAAALEEVVTAHDAFDRQAIRRRAEEEFDYRHLALRLRQLYEEVLGAAPAQSGSRLR